jgi:hypothetical protein
LELKVWSWQRVVEATATLTRQRFGRQIKSRICSYLWA